MTTRELATLIWLGVVLLLCLVGRSTRHTLADVGKAILNIKIAAPLVSYAAVVVAATWLAWRLGYWDVNLVGAVLLWFLFTGFNYFLQSTDAGKEIRFFRRGVLEVISVGALYDLFLNIRTFSLWVEIVLQFVLVLVVMLRVVAQSNEELKSASKFLGGVFALIVVWLLMSTAVNLGDHWDHTEPHDVLDLFLVPVWLTAVTLPFVYIVALAGGYGRAFVRMSFACDDSPLSWKARAGVARELRGRFREIDQFVAPWTWQAGKARTFRGARQIVKEFKAARADDADAAAAAKQRIVENAGLKGTNEDGRQLDEREFKETRDALQWLATCQTGWYQRQEDGGRYREDLLEILGNDFTKNGLPPKHGIIMRVAPDGQSWCAQRRTVTGWVFAIGASEQPPSQWLYDGADPVRGFPGRQKAGGSRCSRSPMQTGDHADPAR